MEITKELLAKAKSAESAEEIMQLAKENGKEITQEQAKNCFAQLNKMGELGDDELNNVSGGYDCTYSSDPNHKKFSVGQRVRVVYDIGNGYPEHYRGKITSVSDERSSTFGFYLEWQYVVAVDDGWHQTFSEQCLSLE